MADFFKIDEVDSSFEQQQHSHSYMVDMNSILIDNNNPIIGDVTTAATAATTTTTMSTTYHLLSSVGPDYYLNNCSQPNMVEFSNVNPVYDENDDKQSDKHFIDSFNLPVDLGTISSQPSATNGLGHYYNETNNLNYTPIYSNYSQSWPDSSTDSSNFSASANILDSSIQTPLEQTQYYPFNYMVNIPGHHLQSSATNEWNNYDNNNDFSFSNAYVTPSSVSCVSLSEAKSTDDSPKPEPVQPEQNKQSSIKVKTPINQKSNSNPDDLARKLEMKRERNRVAARKCRNKKLQQIEEYEKNIAILQKDIEKSEAELKIINARKFELRAAIMNALSSIPLVCPEKAIIFEQNNQ
ncbi:uncharacterized protein LOC113790750 [Dermatophagoides pteronyssinus]|uniref:uncharacterized protein LOC113790750 n=1 Tax=Dermatophagoides pteronyssinus TaxID=6956 RepID=UPI003F677605